MAIVVKSIAELQRVMMEQVHKAMEESSDELINEIQDSVDEVVYKAYQNSEMTYERTKSLQKTLRSNPADSKHNTQRATIAIDHDKKQSDWYSVKSGNHYYNVPERVVNGHYGTFTGIGKATPYSADGQKHNIVPNARHNHQWSKPRDYMKHAEEKLEGYGYLNKCLVRHLPSHIKIV